MIPLSKLFENHDRQMNMPSPERAVIVVFGTLCDVGSIKETVIVLSNFFGMLGFLGDTFSLDTESFSRVLTNRSLCPFGKKRVL